MDVAKPQQWSAYTYAGNNPTTFSDLTGHIWDYDYEIGNEGSDPNHMAFPNGTTLDIDERGDYWWCTYSNT